SKEFNQLKADFGNKHATLVLLHNHFKAHPMEGVEVPLPHGISTQEVENFLQNNAPDFFIYWEKLGELFSKESDPGKFFDIPEVNDSLAKAQQEITRVFKHFPLPMEMRNWLKGSQYYMVRSTGAEDGEKTANAGAHKSYCYVK